ncbi:MAG TPA: hypothetical protein VEC57_14755 [Candidatus Limnocylindrales bacterium]|nr:hypothetical protein [Candidatus Limnocylindrales bacterium]
MTTALRDALQLRRPNVMRQRRAEALARRPAGQERQCAACTFKRGVLAAVMDSVRADADPADLANTAPGRAH